MTTKTVEAQLVISGKDAGASAAVAQVVRSFEQAEKASRAVSREAEQVAKSLMDVERQQKALNAVLGSQKEAAAAEANLARLRTGALTAAGAVDKARATVAAFEAQKPARGTEMAAQANAAAKALSAAEREQRNVNNQIRQATIATEVQTRALQQAERAAIAANIPLKGLEQHQRHLAQAYDLASDAMRRQIRIEEQAARAATHHAREQAEAARHMRQHGVVGYATGAVAGVVAAHSVAHGTGDALKAGAHYQHELVALRNNGRTSQDMEEIAKASERTVRAVPTATFTENLKVINETISAFGSVEHALEHLTFMQKAASVVHAAAGGKISDSAGEMGNKMARFAEERGSAMDGHRFERETAGLVRAMVFSGGNFNPHEAINFAQQAKSSLRGYDEDFLTLYMPSIVGTMKGERAGTAANAFNNVVNGKVNDKKQAEEWMRYGLLDPSQVIMKAGHATAWRAGAVKGTTLAHQNPLRWMEEVVLPALKAKGVDIDNDEELSKVFATMFRQNTSNFFANEIGLKSFRGRLHKDAALQKQAGTMDEIYDRNLKQDPTESLKALRAGLEDVMAAASSPLMQPAAAGLKMLAEGLQSLALMAKDHPYIAAGAGGAAAAGGLMASGYASYKIATGFGLPAAAAELSVAAKMLQASAVKPGVDPKDVVKAAPLVGLGLGGAIAGLGVGAVVAGVATAQQLPKVAEKEGPGAIDPGTGEHLDSAVPDTKPWLRDWWVSHAPVMLGGAPEETGKRIGEDIGKGLQTVPLPPLRPEAFDALKQSAGTAGQEAGTAAGQAIAEGVKAQAPAVSKEGLSILQRLQELLSGGVNLPIHLSTDGLGGLGGAGGGGLGGLIQKANYGGGGGGGGGGSGGGPMPGVPSSVGMTEAERNTLGLILKYESHGRNVMNYIGDSGHTAQGYYQITNTNWRRIAPRFGIKAPNAMSASLEDQTRVAHHLLRTGGVRNWSNYNPALRGALGRGERVPVRRSSAPTVPPPPTIPEAPRAGSGHSADAAVDRLGEHIARLGDHVDRFTDARVRSHHTVEVNAAPGLKAYTSGMRTTSTGPMRSSVGVSMPHVEVGHIG